MSVRIGYKASAEQFGARQLLEFSLAAEAKGMEIVAVSDHFQPWRHNGGQAPAAMPWLAALGQSSDRAVLGTSVLTPTLRYHLSIVAQAFATLASLSPGRIFLGIGSGEAMNETPATGQEFPGRKERRLRLAEAIELIRRLWDEERVDFSGDYYEVSKATIYERPKARINKREWWLLPDQQPLVIAYWQAQGIAYTSCLDCPHGGNTAGEQEQAPVEEVKTT